MVGSLPDKALVEALASAGTAISLIVVLLVLVIAIGGIGMFAIRAATKAGQSIATSQRELTLALTNLIGQQGKVLETAETTHQAIRELRQDLSQHVVQINLRFEQLPDQFKQILGAEMARQLGGNRQSIRAPGILAWLFGGERLG